MLSLRLEKKITVIITLILLLGFFPSKVHAQSGIDLILNYIESQPKEGQFTYDVAATFSLLDSAGNPINDLDLADISVSEDGQGLTPDSLEVVTDQPIYISLLIDTSGSMTGSKIEAAVDAANQFVAGLNSEDRISITTFNSEIQPLIDFSTDHGTVSSAISSIDAISGSGTCLYDAAYQAIQNTAALPLGRRAVIILTDGKDELLTGEACSTLNIDDVIQIASEGNTRVPVFTIGLGQEIDAQGLTRISTLTGGRYEQSPNADQLEGSFSRLLDLLQSQYMLHYTSNAAPGSHTLVIRADYLNATETDSRDFILPALPLHISIISPTSGQEIKEKVKIVAAITGQGEPIDQVIFSANDEVIGNDKTVPYEVEWTPSYSLNGDVTIIVKAVDSNGIELTSSNVLVKINVHEIIFPTAEATQTLIPTTFFTKENMILYGGILAGVIVLIVGMMIIVSSKKRKEGKRRDDQWNKMVVNPPTSSTSMNEMTMDGFVLSENSLGALMVMQSDDPAMLGQRYEITEESTSLGRAADNDILFPKDGPVSRHHAIIENRNGGLILSELVSASADGTTKTPTFGTYLNDQKITRPVALTNGDMIRLGKRVVLKFESAKKSDEEDDARTMDQFSLDDVDKTMDS